MSARNLLITTLGVTILILGIVLIAPRVSVHGRPAHSTSSLIDESYAARINTDTKLGNLPILDERLANLNHLFGIAPPAYADTLFLVPPSISSISPSSPQTSVTDQIVRVNGSNFVSGLTVTVTFPSGGTTTLSGPQIQNVTSSSFTMKITLNGTGTWRIRVNNPNGQMSGQFQFNVTAAQTPTISSISPSSPSASNSDQNVSVSGSNFQNGMTVNVFFPGGGSGTLSGSQLQNVTPTSFTMVVTLNLTGTYGIRVNNPSGLNSTTFNFTVRPSITAVSPSSPCVRSNDQSLTVNGAGFAGGLTVTIFFPGGGSTTLNGTQIQNVTSTSFTMVVTLNLQGQYGIRVNNPNGTQSNTFNFNTQHCVNISSINPTSPPVSNGNQNVVVNGSGFASGLTVTVFFPGGGSTDLSESQIQNVTSNSFTMIVTLNVLGQYGIRVNNPGGNRSNTFNFNTQNPLPNIGSISPSSPCVNGGDQNVVVTGSNFQSGLTVTVFFPGGGTTTLSGSQIQNVAPTSFTMVVTLNLLGQYGIRVNNPNATQSSTFNFNTQFCTTISTINPASPTISNNNQNVVVNGSNFVSGLTVTVFFPGGGSTDLNGAQIQNVTSNSFTMVATLNVLGQYGIRVNNPNGNRSNTFNFSTTTGPPPSVTSINPATPISSGVDQNVSVTGTNFQQDLTVTLMFPGGGTETLRGTQIQNVTSTSFTMRVTLGTAGSWSMRVNNPNGGQSSPFGFNVQSGVQQPVIYSINPVTPIAGSTDQDVIVSGANFQQNLQVPITFPGGGGTTLSGQQIQNVTASSFVMRATLNASGNWTIRVNNPDGGQSPVFGFSVSPGGNNPNISSINPATPMTSGADQNVIVSGSNFQNGLRVNVTFPSGGVSTLQGTGQIQNVTANSFLMRITLNAPGAWTIRVVNPDNSQSGQFQFSVNLTGPPPSGLPTSVLSPVIGPLRVTTANQGISDGKWEFNQHGTGYHTPTGGISLTNDTKAWDVNLYTPTSGSADAGKPVFATAAGEVVSFVGTPPGGGPGAVLIAHPNAVNPVWFSGYLHMTNIRVSTVGQLVDTNTILGEIGRTGADNDHLHFAVYSGQNIRGSLQSFNAFIIERSAGTSNLPSITGVSPSVVTQGGEEQSIIISGANFQQNSFIQVQDPNGLSFTVTPQSISGTAGDSRIEAISATSITANIAFGSAGTYEISVINPPQGSSATAERAQSFSVSSTGTVQALPSGRTPVILIPGIMGSILDKRQANGSLVELWPSLPDWLGGLNYHFDLKNNVEDPSNYRPIGERPVIATSVLRRIGFNYYGNSVGVDFYGKLIDYLRQSEGYSVDPARYPTIAPCTSSRNSADLFVFPYDWRNSNFTSARDLYEFVQCIKAIRGNPPNFKVHIIAHSMGGLVARRYILQNPNTHYVERMVTLGTPWLGATRAINILETGEYDSVNRLIGKNVLQQIARHIKGAHELIPSRAYDDDLDNRVLGEDGWDDFDFLPQRTPWYSFGHVKSTMNLRYPPNNPGTRTETFHNGSQDEWSAANLFGVDYYNFVGYGTYTIGALIAKKDLSGNEFLASFGSSPAGDGTVPLVSALRYKPNRPDLPNYRGPIAREKGFLLDHGELASPPAPLGSNSTFRFIGCVVNVPDANACIDRRSAALGQEVPNYFEGQPNYLLNVVGSSSVVISDAYGNTTDPLSTSVDEGVETIRAVTLGEKSLVASFPLDQIYRAVIKTPFTPFSIAVLKSDGTNVTQAVRYVDIVLPANVLALIELSPKGITTLVYDSNGDGTFDTPVSPTISVNGTQAQDIEPPNVVVNETVQSGSSQVVLEATDSGVGVRQIMYSLNGITFQPYSNPLILSSSQTPTIYVYADDNVYNRSGLVTHNLTTSTAGFSVAGPPVATPSSQITANWNAPVGRPIDDWVGLFRVGTLNSTFISAQNTNGQTSGSFVFSLPAQAGIYEFRYLTSGGFTSVAASNQIIVPAAAEAIIRGQVRTSSGRGLFGVTITLSGPQGESRIGHTNSFGYFQFPAVSTGQTYTIRASSKGGRIFTPNLRQIVLIGNVSDVDFTSNY